MKYFMMSALLIACGDKEDSATEDTAETEEIVEESEQIKPAGRHGLQMPHFTGG